MTGKRVLFITPDATRSAPMPMMFRIFYDAIGEQVAGRIEPLDCAVPCVVEVDGVARANPDWVEPR